VADNGLRKREQRSKMGVLRRNDVCHSEDLNVCKYMISWASLVVQLVKNLPAVSGDVKDMGSTPGSGRFPGVGTGNLLQCSCLENSMDSGAWQATVHRVTKTWT